MIGKVVLSTVFVFVAVYYNISCHDNGDCPQGTTCMGTQCIASNSCPFPTIPKVKKGCQMETSLYLPSQCPKLIENCEPCPKNSAFQGCSNLCGQKTCSNLIAMSRCFSLLCGPSRCQCNYGYVQLTDNIQDGCVKPKDCPKHIISLAVPEGKYLGKRSSRNVSSCMHMKYAMHASEIIMTN
ncbi:unnamed protein product [Haemonchus placei]|uniref:TIL domain-containing protein n=1 Tax=Haemonchus placei TaxID=6290 RepID=A0A158QLY0_HAEPC|nr:unnamed protein product [Haemonchus placei]